MRPPLPPSRLRRLAKWAGLVLCLQTATTWWITERYTIAYQASFYHRIMADNNAYIVSWFSSSLTGEGESLEAPDEDSLSLQDLREEIFYYTIQQTVLGWKIRETTPLPVMFADYNKRPRLELDFELYSRVVIPYWLILLVAVPPTAFLWHRDRRTVKPGHCVKCGYDLRASKKRCPECGTAIVAEAQ